MEHPGFKTLPTHIAMIMDGNGRWAKKRLLPRTAGHKVGLDTFVEMVDACSDLGIPYMTVYAFSTENWKRPKEEVDAIMGLLGKYLREAIDTMKKENIRLAFFGDLSPLSEELRDLCRESSAVSQTNDGFQANICLNYGGRDELVRAAKKFAMDCVEGKADPNHLTEDAFSDYLWSKGIPDPDLIIRPSGEIRISNFLLWQSAYAEFYFTNVLWPDFDRAELDRALIDFQSRSRRFGGV